MKRLSLGICDNPRKQSQPVLKVDLLKSNIVIFGAPMSGKTTLVKTMLKQMHENVLIQYEKENSYIEENIYIIDFGGALGRYGDLCNVCACFDNSNEENVRRIFKSVEKQMNQNSKHLDGQNFVEYIADRKNNTNGLPHITLIIENVTAFLAEEHFAMYHELLLKFCREGLSKGLTVVLTASDTKSGLKRFLLTFNQKIAFELPNEEYTDIYGTKFLPPMKLQGRGLAIYHSEPLEFHAFLPFDDEIKEFPLFVEEMNKRYATLKTPEKLKNFKGDLTAENFAEFSEGNITYDQCLEENKVVLGLDYYEHKPVKVDLNTSRLIGIYGKRAFGKTNLLRMILKQIRRDHPDCRFVFFDDGRKQLMTFYEALAAENYPEENNVYFTKNEKIVTYLSNNGYCDTERGVVRREKEKFVEKDNPFTVFVLQSKLTFQASTKSFVKAALADMHARAEECGYMFIFSDVRKSSDPDVNHTIANTMSVAFLLDNIGEFVADKGSHTPFAERGDAKELKMEYAKCELGDGYCYDIESDDLKKVKFIKEL